MTEFTFNFNVSLIKFMEIFNNILSLSFNIIDMLHFDAILMYFIFEMINEVSLIQISPTMNIFIYPMYTSLYR